MQIWLFSSENIQNIHIGFNAGMWAVSDIDDSTMKQRHTKSRSMKIGNVGLIYCSEDGTFTMPFEVLTQPTFEKISGVWPEPWGLPFKIKPLGSPSRTIHKDAAKQLWSCLHNVQNPTFVLNGMNGRTIFLPTNIPDSDWNKIIKDLGFEDAINN